ncbi:MAG: hypothetical protein HY078_08990 [Elusimicrobia bacterium]|nr:hypothetical protein [Elusimicrobiota bacterium]
MITQERIAPHRSAPKDDYPVTVLNTLRFLWADAVRKRVQMGQPTHALSVAKGFLTINLIAVAILRFSILLQRSGLKLFAMPLYYLNIILFSFDASPYCSIGPGFVVAHLPGCTLHAKFGRNCTLFGRNGVGGRGQGDTGGWLGGPILGDWVTVGYGGSIVTDAYIGDHAMIGAGSWCFGPVKPNTIVFGMPAKPLRVKTERELEKERP